MAVDQWRHEQVRVNGLRFHYVTAGSGPLVVLLHGFPQFWYAWRRQIPALAERFRVVAPDLRGYGETDRPPKVRDYALPLLVEDIAQLIAALGESKAHIVAHDWGGPIAWALATERPQLVDRLAVINCPHPAKYFSALTSNWRQLLRSWYAVFFQIPRIPEWCILRNNGALLDAVFRGSAFRKEAFSDEDLANYKQAFSRPGAATASLNYYRAAFRNSRPLKRLSITKTRISAPTLLIWGENDAALGKELTDGMDGLFSGPFQIRFVPDCSHWVMEEQPELVNGLLLEFLS